MHTASYTATHHPVPSHHSSPIPARCRETSPAPPPFSSACFPPVPTLPLVPWITALLALLCSFGALFPSLPQLLLPPDCVQPQQTGVRDCKTPLPHSSAQPICRRARGFTKEDRATGGPGGSRTAYSSILVCSDCSPLTHLQ